MRASVRTALFFAALLSAGPLSAQTHGPIERLAWLAGCWEGATASEQVEENWMPLRAGTMVGAARATREGRTTSVELTVIRMRGDTLAYHAFPVGQAPAVFPAESLDDSTVVFANPVHDFPRRIIYRRVGADSLVARIEGPGRDGQIRGFDYRMRRGACPGAE